MFSNEDVFQNQPLGYLNLETFLTERSSQPGVAKVEIQLIDAGMIRPFSQIYHWRVDEEDNSLLITPISNTRQTRQVPFALPRVVALTPQMIAFIGAYDGDGNKTGDIGFAQNEVHLQEFIFTCLRKLFGDSFEVDVSLLEDTRYFESDSLKTQMDRIVEEWQKQGIPANDIVERKVQEQVLLERYEAQFASTPRLNERRIRYTISPLKGARTAGASSFEIIRNFVGSRRALPLLLDIIKSVIKTICLDQAHSELTTEMVNSAITWAGSPRSFSHETLDAFAFTSSDRCRYVTSRGFVSYQVTDLQTDTLWLTKPNGKPFAVHRFVPITPLLCLMFGLYLAEGTTSKGKFFTFRNYPEKLALGFNSSEEISLDIFLGGLATIFPLVDDIFDQWLVKIGTKYFAETTSLAEKLGVPVVRRGPKGQGVARTQELAQAVKNWALMQSPLMQKWEHKFSHIEFTGSGIARIDIRCKESSATFIFSLIRDLVFEPEVLSEFIRLV